MFNHLSTKKIRGNLKEYTFKVTCNKINLRASHSDYKITLLPDGILRVLGYSYLITPDDELWIFSNFREIIVIIDGE